MEQIKLTPILSHSQHNFLKDNIFEQSIKGGLLHPDRTQKIIGSYFYATEEHTPKLKIMFGIATERSFEYIITDKDQPKTIVFDKTSQLDCLIMNLLKAKIYMGRKTGQITPFNFDKVYLKQDLERVEAVYRMQIE